MNASGLLSFPASTWLAIFFSLVMLALGRQLLIHPLRKYPGPFLAKFTDGFIGYHAMRKRLHLATFDSLAKYGPVIRVAPNRLVFNTVEAFHDIYLNPNISRSSLYIHTQFHPEQNILGVLGKDEHRRKRRLYSQILSDRSLRAFEPTMTSEINIFLRNLLQFEHTPVNMAPICQRVAADVAGHLAFGQSLKTQNETANRTLINAMASVNGMINIWMSWPITSTLKPLLRRLNRKNSMGFIRVVENLVKQRKALPKDAQRDFYSIAASDESAGEDTVRQTELWSEASIFLPAGLSGIFFYLSRSPSAYAALAAEIRTTFTSGKLIKNGAELSGCKYLRAVIDESLRVSPPFVGTLWREPSSSLDKPIVVDGEFIPPGTIIGVNPYCIMHNDLYYTDPFEFKPERWLEPQQDITEAQKSGSTRRSTVRDAFATFALGDTGCVGKAMAYQEMSLIVAKTMWYFDFQRAPGKAGELGGGEAGRKDGRHRASEYQLIDNQTSDKDGPNLVFKAREEHCHEL